MSRREYGEDRRVVFACILIGVTIGLLVVAALQIYFSQSTQQAASQQVATRIQQQLSLDLAQVATKRICEVIHFEKDQQGRVTAVLTDSIAMNQLQHDMLLGVYDSIAAADFSDLTVFANDQSWIRIPIRSVFVEEAFVEFQNSFTDAGINQTRHSTTLLITASIVIQMPTFQTQTTINEQFAVYETLIVGAVPYEYHQGSEQSS